MSEQEYRNYQSMIDEREYREQVKLATSRIDEDDDEFEEDDDEE